MTAVTDYINPDPSRWAVAKCTVCGCDFPVEMPESDNEPYGTTPPASVTAVRMRPDELPTRCGLHATMAAQIDYWRTATCNNQPITNYSTKLRNATAGLLRGDPVPIKDREAVFRTDKCPTLPVEWLTAKFFSDDVYVSTVPSYSKSGIAGGTGILSDYEDIVYHSIHHEDFYRITDNDV